MRPSVMTAICIIRSSVSYRAPYPPATRPPREGRIQAPVGVDPDHGPPCSILPCARAAAQEDLAVRLDRERVSTVTAAKVDRLQAVAPEVTAYGRGRRAACKRSSEGSGQRHLEHQPS